MEPFLIGRGIERAVEPVAGAGGPTGDLGEWEGGEFVFIGGKAACFLNPGVDRMGQSGSLDEIRFSGRREGFREI